MELIRFTNKGIYCVPGDFYIDPWLPVDKAVITHAHADHARSGMKHYLCHHHTRAVLQSRLGGGIHVSSVAYGETLHMNGVLVSLHPAGHIIGSAQVRMEYRGYVAVVSGDYKTADDGLSVAFELQRCHEFVTESTFGLPVFHWEKNETSVRAIQDWVEQNRQQQRSSILVAYALGKAQRLMKAMEGRQVPYVHYSIAKLNEAMEQSGILLPPYKKLEGQSKSELQGSVVIVPPSLLGTSVLKQVPDAATAVCSGWMQVRGHRRWRAVDAGFPISDHADWDGLIDTIKATGANKVHVTHGYTAVFSRYLNEIGIEAHEVTTRFGEEEDDEALPVLKEETP